MRSRPLEISLYVLRSLLDLVNIWHCSLLLFVLVNFMYRAILKFMNRNHPLCILKRTLPGDLSKYYITSSEFPTSLSHSFH